MWKRGNFWYHLKMAHSITKDNIDNVSNIEHNQINLLRKQILNNKIISFICKDQQPLAIITDDGFIELIKEAQQLMDKFSETLFYGSLKSDLSSDLALDTDDNSVMIDFESSMTIFDDDIIYEDADEKIDEINNRT
ncbi:20953_t:CDS:2 [Racocetra persica]|uniref:20953_t:CDS:1 n=1 Tax=Racocetra persica TaxID=160502 RepID=A0ACA9KRG4_9GLOM|nr:20953_t:CDS:2 [Racocetra persica]